jgi:branched-chain amino acid aminotransferase
VGPEIADGRSDRREPPIPERHAAEDLIKPAVGAVVAEPIVGDAFFQCVRQLRREQRGMGSQVAIAGADEVPERNRGELVPAAGEEVIVDQIDDHSGEAAAFRGDEPFQPGGHGVLVGLAVDRPVADDALHHRQRQRQRFRPAGHEVAEQVADARKGVVFGKQQVGEVVQALTGARPATGCNAGFPPEPLARHTRRVSWIWCNGEFLDGPLAVSPADRGLTNGLGLFETLLAIDGAPLALARHLARMKTGAAKLGWEFSAAGMEAVIAELLGRCGLESGRARVRIALTAGAGDLRSLSRGEDSLCWITASTCPEPPESVTLATAPFPRNDRSPLAGLKCASYAENLIALDHARRAGADEALFYNIRGELCEAAMANVFLVKDGAVLTPPLSSGCLPGTMRERVLECFPVAESVLTAADVVDADGAFLTSATRGVVPVASIDGRPLSSGPVVQRLSRRIREDWG